MTERVEMPCPECKGDIECRLSTMKPGESMRCRHCGEPIIFTGNDFSKIPIDDIERSAKAANRRVRIHF
jgi:hypothetical protein